MSQTCSREFLGSEINVEFGQADEDDSVVLSSDPSVKLFDSLQLKIAIENGVQLEMQCVPIMCQGLTDIV